MSAPVVVSVQPDVNETDVVLGQPVIITFDQGIDTTTLSDSTFNLSFPAPTQIITSGQLISGPAGPSTVPVHGAWTFATDGQNRTVATFTPPNMRITRTPSTPPYCWAPMPR